MIEKVSQCVYCVFGNCIQLLNNLSTHTSICQTACFHQSGECHKSTSAQYRISQQYCAGPEWDPFTDRKCYAHMWPFAFSLERVCHFRRISNNCQNSSTNRTRGESRPVHPESSQLSRLATPALVLCQSNSPKALFSPTRFCSNQSVNRNRKQSQWV